MHIHTDDFLLTPKPWQQKVFIVHYVLEGLYFFKSPH